MGACGQKSTETINEIKIPGTSDSISFEGLAVINEQKENNVCKIIKENDTTGTGFLCIIPFPDKLHPLPTLITCNHVINEDDIQPGKQIKLIINDKIEKILTIDDSRMIYTSPENEFDTTIIEIKNEDNFDINSMLEIDNNIYKNDLNNYYKNKTVYLIHYPNGLKSSYSHNIIKNIDVSNTKLYHLCESNDGSSGAPILNLQNFSVMGIHVGKKINMKVNVGFVLKPIIDKFYNIVNNAEKKNEIIVTIHINKNDINKKIYFLDNSGNDDQTEENRNEHLSELNESNVKLYINDSEFKYSKYFVPEKEGKYNIKLVFNIEMKDCSYMFNQCSYIEVIDLSSFNSRNVKDMSYMFYKCISLKRINLTNFQTGNVINMQKMFYECEKLLGLNLTYFDTSNVTDMSYMFAICKDLIYLDISSFDTKKVTNMEGLFAFCINLNFIDVSSFNTENVTNMKYMFYYLYNVRKLNLSSFNTEKVTNMSKMFKNSQNLTLINLTSFNTKNVEDMSGMFHHCRDLQFLNLQSFNTENVKYMHSMFQACINLLELDLSNFNTKNVISMTQMFYKCTNLSLLDISSFEVENVQYLNLMFSRCPNLIFLDLTSFKINQQNVNGMFCECDNYITFLFNISFQPKLEIALNPDNEEDQCPYSASNINNQDSM